jgi:GAF domain-containing protein
VGEREAIGSTFVELADTLVEGYDLIEFLHLLAERCVLLLGVAEAGVVLMDSHGKLRTLASSSERMRLIELVEVQRQDGPCLDCCRHGKPVEEDDLEVARERWPRFAPAALDVGLRSVYALPLRLRQERIGALNLFADRPRGLTAEERALGQAMADVATIGILHARLLHDRQTLTEQLQTALTSRVSLEQAKGIVAEQAGVEVGDAFHLLRAYARHHNRYIGEVVTAVLAHDLSAADLRIPVGSRGRARADGAGHERLFAHPDPSPL